MTATSSTVNPVRQQLVTLWQPLFPAALVVRGGRYTTAPGELLVVGDVDGSNDQQVMNGPARPTDEQYTVQCIASVTWNSSVDDQSGVEDRCQAIATAATLAVLQVSDWPARVPGLFWLVPRGPFSQRAGAASDSGGGVNTQITFSLSARARYRIA